MGRHKTVGKNKEIGKKKEKGKKKKRGILKKMMSDCYFYYGGLGLCERGDTCCYRHEPRARGCLTVCELWRQGSCSDIECPKRHSHFDLHPFGILEDRQGGMPKFISKRYPVRKGKTSSNSSKSKFPHLHFRWSRFNQIKNRIRQYKEDNVRRSKEKSHPGHRENVRYEGIPFSLHVIDGATSDEANGKFTNSSVGTKINRFSESTSIDFNSNNFFCWKEKLFKNVRKEPNAQYKMKMGNDEKENNEANNIKLENVKSEINEFNYIKLETFFKTGKNN